MEQIDQHELQRQIDRYTKREGYRPPARDIYRMVKAISFADELRRNGQIEEATNG